MSLGCVRIHDFRNGRHCESSGSSCMKTRSDSLFLYTMASTSIFLTENDIPGASLLGRKPEELKISELKFWLKCRGDPGKRLKTKADLVT